MHNLVLHPGVCRSGGDEPRLSDGLTSVALSNGYVLIGGDVLSGPSITFDSVIVQ
jgi:hypothetical protein